MRTIKLVIIGDSGVGKTSLRSQYILGRFSTGYRATIGTDFITKTLPHHSDPEQGVTLQIWDTAGQERFSSLSSAFFRGADAALLMFDINRPETLVGLARWWDQFKACAPVLDEEAEDFCCVVVGNKVDLAAEMEGEGEGEEYINGSGALTRAGHGHERPRVTEAEAERFLEELVPRTAAAASSGTMSDDEEEGAAGWEWDDPFAIREGEDGIGQNRRTSNLFLRPSISGFSLHSVHTEHHAAAAGLLLPVSSPSSGSKPRSQSISIQRGAAPSHPYTRGAKSKSRSKSSDRSQFGGTIGTMASTRTAHTLYHTPSSSFFGSGSDAFESAQSSPYNAYSPLPLNTHDPPATDYPTTPSPTRLRSPRRMASGSSSNSSAPTITPSLFLRAQASASNSAAPTPPTPPDILDDARALSLPFPSPASGSKYGSARLPPAPERRPKLFLASAKTGEGVAGVFEYVARRVVMRAEHTEAIEARTMHVRDASAYTLRLTDAGPRRWGPGGVSCCRT
ncbi:ras-domain-containing protein [Phellopilus nigrolimitatus]|nr:ras-domain-containing protein [Phellopilus nigrolimitatus]